MKKNIILLLIIFCMSMPLSLISSGISTTFTEVLIENLQIGKSYSLKKIFNKPYSVKNNSSQSTGFKIKLLPSNEKYLRDGYEPLTDKAWVRLAQTNFKDVPGGKTVFSDIIINPPDDPSYFNKKYQVSIVSETYDDSSKFIVIGTAVESFLLFTIAPFKDKISQDQINKLDFNINYNVTPPSIVITNLEIQKAAKTFKAGELFIENFDDKEHTYQLKSLSLEEMKRTKRGYEAAPEPGFLSFSSSSITIPAKESKKISLYLNFPYSTEYKGKKYQFTINTFIDGKDVKGQVYTRIFITTKR